MDILERIALLKREVEDATAVLERDGIMTVGSQGQPVTHPLVGARHQAIALLHKLEAKLPDVPETDPLDEFLARD